jgi:hypothetical protein
MWSVWYITAMHADFGWENLQQTGHLEGLGVDGNVILKRIMNKYDQTAWNGFIWLRKETSSFCEQGAETLRSKYRGEFD